MILDNYPPSTLQGVGLGGRKNPRVIVGEHSCHFGTSKKKKAHKLMKSLRDISWVSWDARRQNTFAGTPAACLRDTWPSRMFQKLYVPFCSLLEMQRKTPALSHRMTS